MLGERQRRGVQEHMENDVSYCALMSPSTVWMVVVMDKLPELHMRKDAIAPSMEESWSFW
jgi:hypothetical protein